MKRKISIVAALLFPAGLALAQSTVPSTPTTPSTPPPASQSSNDIPSSTEGDRDRGAGADIRAHFEALDTDADGRLSKTEAAIDEKLGRRFDKLDDNTDGYLDGGEYRRFASRARGDFRSSTAAGE